jgi:phage terminase Nu1 subunit (DNA packaging protein)
MKPKNPGVSSAEVADWLVLSERRVRELGAAGILVRCGKGRYDLKRSVQSYARHQREISAGRAGVDPSTDIAQANVDLKREQAKLARLRYQREAGDLVSFTELHQILDPLTLALRNMFLGFPGKAQFEIPTLTPTDRATLERIVHDDLQDASQGRAATGKPRLLISTDPKMKESAMRKSEVEALGHEVLATLWPYDEPMTAEGIARVAMRRIKHLAVC